MRIQCEYTHISGINVPSKTLAATISSQLLEQITLRLVYYLNKFECIKTVSEIHLIKSYKWDKKNKTTCRTMVVHHIDSVNSWSQLDSDKIYRRIMTNSSSMKYGVCVHIPACKIHRTNDEQISNDVK